MPEGSSNQFLTSSPRIWNQFMMFVILVGALPLLFPQWVHVESKSIVLIIVGTMFVTSVSFEIWRSRLEKQKKDTSFVVDLQLLTRAILLTVFLHFFGRINGPFFVLYLLVIMELFLSENVFLANLIIGTMVFATAAEFVWLLFLKETVLGFIPLISLTIRIISIIFMHAYGSVLAQKTISEREAIGKTRETTRKVDSLAHELKKTNTKLKELSVLKDEFISVASHELRAPMTMIKGYISMILEGDVGKIPPKVKEFLKDAYENSDRMIRLINNMLNVSRIESGQLIIGLKDIQIEKTIEKIVKNYRLKAKSHGLELKYTKPKEKLPRVRVDPDRIRQVITNLIENAISFTPQGFIHVRVYQENGMVTVTVKDTGIGISPQDQKQLFKKFSQIEVGTTLKKGSGLGLYICKMLVNEFGGEIWLKSKRGKGTTFYFSLPAIVNFS